jgi:uncharacterized protein (DUF2147 family)
LILGAVVLLIAAGGIVFALMSQASSKQPSVPSGYLGGLDQEASGQTVDGIACGAMESLAFHIHAHLAAYVEGQPKKIPAGIGITAPRQLQTLADGSPFVGSGGCFYWLHTHTEDGVIHIESPVQRSFTLGQFFDIWNLKLSGQQVGSFKGKVIVYLDGKAFSGDPRSLPLAAHTLVQLDVGQDVPPQQFTFQDGL